MNDREDKKIITLKPRVSVEGPPPNPDDPSEPNTYRILFRDRTELTKVGYLVVTDKFVTVFKSYGNISFYAPSELIQLVELVEVPLDKKVLH